MSTNQPQWQFIANLGDASPLDFGGLFVYVDKTGIYSPECVRLERITDDETRGPAERWQAHRFILEPCTYDAQTDTLSDNPFHPEIAAWFAPNAAQRADRPQDGEGLQSIADFIGITKQGLIGWFLSDDPRTRAAAWSAVGDYHGFANLDDYPEIYTRKELYRYYRKECFARSVRRVSRASVRNAYGNVLTVGTRVSFGRVNDSKCYTGTIKAIDRTSEFARAYGPQITFTDSPFTVTANDCKPYAVPSGETGPFAIPTI